MIKEKGIFKLIAKIMSRREERVKKNKKEKKKQQDMGHGSIYKKGIKNNIPT
jgi:hypothetical protein